VEDWKRLYNQRVRWRRGQIEVFGLHKNMLGNKKYGFFGLVMFPLTLLIDHTLALPRLIWTMLLPLLVLFGYSPKTIFSAIVIMTMFHILVDFFNVFACYLAVDNETRDKIKKTLHYNFIVSTYRFIVFYFRFSGFLIALREAPRWGTSSGAIEGTKKPSPGGISFLNKDR
jgi:hypothetical protein